MPQHPGLTSEPLTSATESPEPRNARSKIDGPFMRAVFPSAKSVACHRNGNRLGARTARRMADRPGRSPDLRVDALFPPSRTRRAQWHRGKSSPLTVAGAVADLASESGLTAFPRDDLSTGAPRPR